MRISRAALTLLCITMAWLGGCSRQEQPTAAQPADAPATPATPGAVAPAPVAETAPADSGLSIKRGIAMVAQDRTTFRPCGENIELWLFDQTDGVLAQAFAAEATKGPAMIYIEAYGERAPVADDIPDARAYGGTFVLEEVLYAGVQGEIRGCDAAPENYIVAARGSEPFWSVQVRDDGMLWKQPDDPKEIALGAPQTQDSEGAVRYHASGAGHELELLIDARACRDPMSGEFFAYSAKAVLDAKEFSGCARVGR
jgi:uncharacterized membrane protein